jgi:glycosyltransferase involved in cell wall biosynthesis
MITLFIFKSNARGMQYGMGTYITELTEALLKHTDIKLFIVSYHNLEFKEFSVETISSRFLNIYIPSPKQSFTSNSQFEKRYASVVVNLLSGFIPKDGEIVFQMNYIDDLSIIIKLKETCTHPIISVVHFAQWQQLFNGNRKKLSGLNIDQPSNNIEFTLSKEKEFYQVSDHIVSVTRYMKDFLINDYGINPEKIAVIPNGLDHSKFKAISKEERINLRKRLGFGKDDIIILFSGRIDPCKGIFYLLEAFGEACKVDDNLRLILLGQGNIQDCQKRLQSSFGKVTYTGFIPKEFVTSFYQVTDIGIVPSIYDHCPYTVLEMMANKIPLIVSRINGLDEILDDTQCLFVNPILSEAGDISFNINELSEAILTIAEDNTLKKNLANNSCKILSKKFVAFRMAEEMNNLFHTLINSNEMTLKYEKNERR